MPRQLSQVADVSSVSAPGGTFVGGQLVRPPSSAAIKDGSAFLTVGSTAPLFSEASETQLDRLRAVAGPGGQHVQMTGIAQINRDSGEAITSRLPAVLARDRRDHVRAAVLADRQRGAAAEGVAAQHLVAHRHIRCAGVDFPGRAPRRARHDGDGHAGGQLPVLLFCIAFGLSMDYEVFLVSRIREYWLTSGRPAADNDESVALGLAAPGG